MFKDEKDSQATDFILYIQEISYSLSRWDKNVISKRCSIIPETRHTICQKQREL